MDEVLSSNVKQKCMIFDLDNCLSNDSKRRHYLDACPRQWASYFSECGKDIPNEWGFLIIRSLNVKVIFLTGRSEEYRAITEKWLREVFWWYSIEQDYLLLMRPEADFSISTLLKEKILTEKVLPEYDVVCAFDDEMAIADMYAKYNINCLVPWTNKR